MMVGSEVHGVRRETADAGGGEALLEVSGLSRRPRSASSRRWM
jgi:hypothetical protein